jgi:hypothetical protein
VLESEDVLFLPAQSSERLTLAWLSAAIQQIAIRGGRSSHGVTNCSIPALLRNAVWIALTGIAVNYFYDVGKDSTWSRRFGFC